MSGSSCGQNWNILPRSKQESENSIKTRNPSVGKIWNAHSRVVILVPVTKCYVVQNSLNAFPWVFVGALPTLQRKHYPRPFCIPYILSLIPLASCVLILLSCIALSLLFLFSNPVWSFNSFLAFSLWDWKLMFACTYYFMKYKHWLLGNIHADLSAKYISPCTYL